jgi:hypothetical protein
MVIFNGDYHWIEFDEPFKLKKNVNYTYEIRTGSYTKYIHNHTLKTHSFTLDSSESYNI